MKARRYRRRAVAFGGEGSGFHGHAGRPGVVGGSTADGGRHDEPDTRKSPADAVAALTAGNTASVAAYDVRHVLKRAAAGDKHIDLAKLSVDGRPIFNGLGMKRDEMPQVPREFHEQFEQQLKQDGIELKTESVDPLSLKPAQSEIDAKFVGENLDKPLSGLRAIYVSKDDYILDGHHRWALAAANALDKPHAGIKIATVRIMLDHTAALAKMEAFDKAHQISRHEFGTGSGTKALTEWWQLDVEQALFEPQRAKVYQPKRKFVVAVAFGGEGSGNHGHAGRPGQVGGSGAGKGPTEKSSDEKWSYDTAKKEIAAVIGQENQHGELLHHVNVDPTPVTVRASETVKDTLQELKDKGYKMPDAVEVLSTDESIVSGETATNYSYKGGVDDTTLRVYLPKALPATANLDAAVKAAFGKSPDAWPMTTVQSMKEVVVHEMGHVLSNPVPALTAKDFAQFGATRGEQMTRLGDAMRSVSHYAQQKKEEFVAEAFVQKYRGEALTPDAQKLYVILHGPEIRK